MTMMLRACIDAAADAAGCTQSLRDNKNK